MTNIPIKAIIYIKCSKYIFYICSIKLIKYYWIYIPKHSKQIKKGAIKLVTELQMYILYS